MDWIESTRACGGPVVLVPCSLIRPYSLEEAATGRQWEGEDSPEAHLYWKACEGGESLLYVFRGRLPEGFCFSGSEVGILHLYTEGGPVIWLSRPWGALAAGWGGLDSFEELKELALKKESSEDWEEEIEYAVQEPDCYLGEATAALFTQPQDCCCVQLSPGIYRVQAGCLDGQGKAGSAVFKFCRKE